MRSSPYFKTISYLEKRGQLQAGENLKMKSLIISIVLTALFLGTACAPERPTEAQLHAYKAVHHAEYLKVTAAEAGGTNKLIHTTKLPTEGTDPVVTPRTGSSL